MANGVIGKTGHHVRRHVELEHRNVRARVPSHAHLLAGKIVLVLVGRVNRVKEYPVQLKSWFSVLISSRLQYLQISPCRWPFWDIKNDLFFSFFLPVDGGWTDWKDWTPCSQTCGTGSQERERSCNQPRPAFGGKDCVGVSRETKSCQARVCPGKIIVLTFSTEAWLPLRPLANFF